MSKYQHGFSIVSAIFLLVVLAFLGAAMTSFSTTQSQSSAMDVMGSRAYQAARAGVEWAAFNVVQSPVSSPVAWPGCVAGGTPVAVAGDLAPFSPVTVNCAAASSVEGTATIWIYAVSAVAQTGGAAGAPDYVERVYEAKLAR